jgi:hypothetical protein
MRRLFTFGCSLTQFFYPTWADLLIWQLGESTDISENWGKSGAGNQFIFTRLMEADSIYNFTKDDLIVIQWTSMYRDDRWIEGTGWHNAGNLYHGQLKHEPMTLNNFDYTDQYQWADQVHCVMRDCAIIKATETFLKNKGCTYLKFQFADYYNDLSDKDSKLDYTKALTPNSINGILNEYKEYLQTDIPAIMDWNGYDPKNPKKYVNGRPMCLANMGDRLDEARAEMHPLPFEYADYVEKFILPKIGMEKLNPKAIELAEHYQTKLTEQNLPVLSKLGWIELNADKIGWSDD